MRILIVHSYYSSSSPSGENRVVDQQVAALRNAGYEIFVHAERTDDRAGSYLYPALAAATVATGMGDRGVSRAIEAIAPDVVHVHNLFPNFGRRWAYRVGAPLIATLHNYRPLCAAATFFRNGKTCTECLDRRSARPAFQHSCYRGSRAHTLPLALSTKYDRDPIIESADRLIVLSKTMRALYERGGVSTEKMTLIPNFLPDELDPGMGGGGDYWLFVGRLSPEKGISEVVRNWPSGRRLVVAGSGPLADEVSRTSPAGVEFVGSLPPRQIRELMAHAQGLIFPSKWFEGFPLVYLEALAAGTPVLAWHPSSVAGMVSADGTGLVGGPDLNHDLERASELFQGIRGHCRAVFEEQYTEHAYLKSVRPLYEDVGGGGS